MKQCKITIKKTRDCFDFTTKCSFLDLWRFSQYVVKCFDFTTKCSFLDFYRKYRRAKTSFDFTTKCSFLDLPSLLK